MPFDADRTAAPPEAQADRPAIGLWLLAVAAMVWVMVALGGATRLTGSGLSIMEWAPIAGALPPLSEAEWLRLFALYKTIPQYELVNTGFGLEGFKRIFWLEWAHRLWGRLIGLAYALPLLWFWWRGRIPRGYGLALFGLLVLGGLQGAVGWFMVASGFEAARTTVSPYRLVVHLGLALALFSALVWTALGLLRPAAAPPPGAGGLRALVRLAFGLLLLAMLAGGFVAGLRAGLDYNTFPLMAGAWVPPDYWRLSPAWSNLTENIPAVQFNHRLLATLGGLAALAAGLLAARRLPTGFARRASLTLAGLATLQYVLGVLTLVHVVPVGLGTLHQANAVLLLAAGLAALHGLRAQGTASGMQHQVDAGRT